MSAKVPPVPYSQDPVLARRNRWTGLAILAVVLAMVALTYVCRTTLFPVFFKL